MSTLKVVSFNVLAQNWIDDELKSHALDRRHLQRGYRVARQIESLQVCGADIILLQEVTPIVLRKFKEKLVDYHVPSCFCRMHWQPASPRDPVNGNAVIWRKGLFAGKAKCDIVELDRKAGNYAAMVTGTLANTGQHLRVISLHLEYGDKERASKQFGRLFNGKNAVIRNHKRVIVGGDFNMGGLSEEEFPVLSDIERHGFNDACSNLRTHPFPIDNDDKTLTHILARGMMLVTPGKTIKGGCSTIGDCLKRYGSDHYPVEALFQP